MPCWLHRVAFVAPVLALGPVTGPLLALAAFSFRNRRPFVGALALAGVAAFWLGAPAVLAAELRLLASHA
ncbi:MAG TPA: hypothetical protein VHS81_03995 [Caulobacteraceae bacterium]|nr:hypothetical protein [Caulobacteraceae bacterium]